VTVTGETRTMRPEAEVALLRTAQEALANVAKHAPPRAGSASRCPTWTIRPLSTSATTVRASTWRVTHGAGPSGSWRCGRIEAGATGYLLKDAPRDELLRAVRSAARGEVALSPSVAARLMSRLRTPAPSTGPLSQRELEVLRLVASGNTNREAAARLFITEATVKTHLLNIYAKLDVNDRAAAVAEGYNRGLLGPPDRGL
jgi:DNA-binding CsgD family transcriptional regulator